MSGFNSQYGTMRGGKFSLPAKPSVPTIIVYEDLLADPQSAVDQIADLFGLRGCARVASERVDLVMQRDATTEEWRARFLAEYRAHNVSDLL